MPTADVSPLASARAVVRALRPHQWAKNALVVLPAALAHELGSPAVVADLAVAVVAMSLCASGTYVVNDLTDRDRDRAHPTKRRRPFASAALSRGAGVGLAVGLVGAAFAVSVWALPLGFTATLATYLALTLAYSAGLKRVAVLDVLVLGALYALRVVAGGAAVGVPLSEWFVVFSLFFFLGLGVLKRYAEVRQIAAGAAPADNGRGYLAGDGPVLGALGVGCGLVAVLVLTLYVTAPEVRALYGRPEILWVAVPVVLYWTARAWLLAHRGRMPDDPVLFAVTDPTTYGLLALVAGAVTVAAR
ncbi:UbiA family prenyltransferase [Rubrivirga sp.]|uniref:UbiA family prenyltransferase n=1 Tax=Rubrivirga sp. TaxID=1885344 RepID=UPI003B51ACD7